MQTAAAAILQPSSCLEVRVCIIFIPSGINFELFYLITI